MDKKKNKLRFEKRKIKINRKNYFDSYFNKHFVRKNNFEHFVSKM